MNDIDLTTIAAAIWITLTIAAIVAATWLVITFRRIDQRVHRSLEQRLANGEIDIEDYRRRVALLGR